MNNVANDFSLLDIENQNMNISLELFEIVKETAEEYCQYVKKYKEFTSQYLDKLSKLTFNKKETKNKNIKLTSIFSMINKVPNLIKQQVEGLTKFMNSFEITIKQLETVLKTELNNLEEPKKFFEDNKKKYQKSKIKNKKLMDSFTLLEKKLKKWQLSKKENENKDKEYKDSINSNINEIKTIEADYLKLYKEEDNFHYIFQEESLKNIDAIKLRIRVILQNLNNNIIFFLFYFNDCYSPSVEYIQSEIKKNNNNPININDLINNSMIIKTFKLEELPQDKYNIKLLEKEELDLISFSVDDINKDNNKKFPAFNFLNFKLKKSKDDDDILSNLSKADILNIVKEFYNNFKMTNKDKYDITAEEEKIEVKSLTDKLLLMKKFRDKKNFKEEIKITDAEKERLFSLIKKKANGLIFLRRLNKIRSFGNFEYEKNIFDDIVKIFLIILDEIQKDKDIFAFQFCIILSQTFYILENDKKSYIFKFIKHHKIYKSEELWKLSIDHFVGEEIEKIEKLKNELGVKNINNKLNDMIFAQIIPIVNNMIEFDLDINIAEKVIMDSFNKYKLKEDSKTIILNLFENKKNNKGKIDENNIIIKENKKISEKKCINSKEKETNDKKDEEKNIGKDKEADKEKKQNK